MPLFLRKNESPSVHVKVLLRSLKIISLLHNPKDPIDWNSSTLSDYLSADENEPIGRKEIERCLDFLRSMGFPIESKKGARRISLNRPFSDSETENILRFFMPVMCRDIKNSALIKNCEGYAGGDVIWLLSKVYFASVMRKRIKLVYFPPSAAEKREYILNPYYWCFRDGGIYLAAFNLKKGIRALYKLQRIHELEVTDQTFYETVPEPEELFRDSSGAFFGRAPLDFEIKHNEKITQLLHEDFANIEIDTEPYSGKLFITRFTACDLERVCRIVFSYGNQAEIVSPKAARNRMIEMLSESISMYKKIPKMRHKGADFVGEEE